MKLTNEEQTKRSLIRTQQRLLELEGKVEKLEDALIALLGRAFTEADRRKRSA